MKTVLPFVFRSAAAKISISNTMVSQELLAEARKAIVLLTAVSDPATA